MERIFGDSTDTLVVVFLAICSCTFVKQDMHRPLLLLRLIGARQDEHFLCFLTKDDESTFLPQ